VDIAGQGVADPSSMLLAAALMLGEASASQGASATLSSAVSYVRGQ
jgi:isocitrate/isopropylmalate dehydrogenase